jgi:16S rRNA (cytidine1402-2'-O)-methyltransferase
MSNIIAEQQSGTLYIVATPIGNRDDLSPRAVKILQLVDIIAAEDTRHSRPLLEHYGITTKLLALHEHNEVERSQVVLSRIAAGESVALISDAGTPLISDPGYRLVRMAHQAGVKVAPIPGPSALITGLSVAALPTDRFSFEGFMPSKRGNRRSRFEALKSERQTMVFYESPHRIVECLHDMVEIFGKGREATLARELTKRFETIYFNTLEGLLEFVEQDNNQKKGEFVLMVAGDNTVISSELDTETTRVADILAAELPVKQAAALTSQIFGVKKRQIYQYLIEHKSEAQS